jgi:hypothetical protein
MVDGQLLVRDFMLTGADAAEIAATARSAAVELADRAGI